MNIKKISIRFAIAIVMLIGTVVFVSSETRLENFTNALGENAYKHKMWVFMLMLSPTLIAFAWAGFALFTKKSSDSGGAQKIVRALIVSALALFLADPNYSWGALMPVNPANTYRYEYSGFVPESIANELEKNPSAKSVTEAMPYLQNVPGKSLHVVGCIAFAVVTIIVVGGAVYIYVKVSRACDNIDKKKKKQMEENDEPSGTNNAAFFSGQTFAAVFPMTSGSPSPEDIADCGCNPPLSISIEPSATRTVNLNAYVPRASLFNWDQYLVRRSLSTNSWPAYSRDGKAVTSLPEITFTNGVIGIWIEGKTNVLSTFEFYPDAQTSTVPTGSLKIYGPGNAHFNFSDSFNLMTRGQGYWKVIRSEN